MDKKAIISLKGVKKGFPGVQEENNHLFCFGEGAIVSLGDTNYMVGALATWYKSLLAGANQIHDSRCGGIGEDFG